MKNTLTSLQMPEEIKNKLISQLTEIGTESKRTGEEVRKNLLESLDSSKVTSVFFNKGKFKKIKQASGRQDFDKNKAIADIKSQAKQYGEEFLNEISKILGESPQKKQIKQAI